LAFGYGLGEEGFGEGEFPRWGFALFLEFGFGLGLVAVEHGDDADGLDLGEEGGPFGVAFLGEEGDGVVGLGPEGEAFIFEWVEEEGVTGAEAGEVFMDGVLGLEEGGVAEVEVFECDEVIGGGGVRGVWWVGCVVAAGEEGGAGEGLRDGVGDMGLVEDGEGLAGAGHTDVEEAAGGFEVGGGAGGRPGADDEDVVMFGTFSGVDSAEEDTVAVGEVASVIGAIFVDEVDGVLGGEFGVGGFDLPGIDELVGVGGPGAWGEAGEESEERGVELGGFEEAGAVLLEFVEEAMDFADLVEWGHVFTGGGPADGEVGLFGGVADACEVAVVCAEDGYFGEGGGAEFLEAEDFVDDGVREEVVVLDLDNLDAAAGEGVGAAEFAAGGEEGALLIDTDGLVGFHAVRVEGDELVGGFDDVGGGAVVFDEVMEVGLVVLLEASDELHVGAAEGVDILVIIADGEDGEFEFGVFEGAAGDGADEFVLVVVDILVFVDEDELESGEEAVAEFIGFGAWGAGLSAEEGGGFGDELVEVGFGGGVWGGGEGFAEEAEGEAVVGEDGDVAGVVTDELGEAFTEFGSGGAVEAADEDGAWGGALDAEEVGAAVDDRAGFTGAGAGEDEEVFVGGGGDDLDLVWVLEAGDDGFEGCGGGGVLEEGEFLFEVALGEFFFLEGEVSEDEVEGLGHLLEGLSGVFAHDVDLEDAFFVVVLEGLVVAGLVACAFGVGLEADGHGGAEDGEALLESDDALFMEEHEGAFDGGGGVAEFDAEVFVFFDGEEEFFEREVDEGVFTRRGFGGDFIEEGMGDDGGDLASAFGELGDRGPGGMEADAVGLVIEVTDIEAALGVGVVASVFLEAFEEGADGIGCGGEVEVQEGLIESGEGEGHPIFGVGFCGAEGIDELAVEGEGEVESVEGSVVVGGTDEGIEEEVTFEEAGFGHIGEDAEDFCADVIGVCEGGGVSLGVVEEFGEEGELVDCERVGGFGIDDGLDDGDPELFFGLGELELGDAVVGIREVLDEETGLEDAGDIFFTGDESGAFEPGDGGADFRIGHTVHEVDIGFDFFVAEDFA
jgi:hypothetical protein